MRSPTALSAGTRITKNEADDIRINKTSQVYIHARDVGYTSETFSDERVSRNMTCLAKSDAFVISPEN